MSNSLRRAWHTVAASTGAFVVLMAPNAHAAVLMSEDFEVVGSSATYYGSASRDCTTANTLLCSVLVPSTTGASRSGAYRLGPWAMSGTTTVSFAFKADCATGDMDGDMTVWFNNSSNVTVNVTEGIGTNNGVSVISSTGDQKRNFTSWPTAGVWYTFTLSINPSSDTATASFGGSSATVSINASAWYITSIDVNGINWGWGCDIHYDTLTLSG